MLFRAYLSIVIAFLLTWSTSTRRTNSLEGSGKPEWKVRIPESKKYSWTEHDDESTKHWKSVSDSKKLYEYQLQSDRKLTC